MYTVCMYTQKELARVIGVTPQHLNAVLRGRVKPSLKLALLIEKHMNISVDRLIPELKDKVSPPDV